MTDKSFALESIALGVAAAVAFGAAIYLLLWKNRTAPAAVSGSLAILAMLFIHFPEIDKVQALSVGFTLDHK
jgi:threonine/homoserine efflux transporter RhtA